MLDDKDTFISQGEEFKKNYRNFRARERRKWKLEQEKALRMQVLKMADRVLLRGERDAST